MERKIQIKAEDNTKYIGIDIIPELLANEFYPLSTDDDMASTLCQSAKSIYKRQLISLVESKVLIPIDPLFLIPYDPCINGVVIWDHMSHLLVPINEFIRVCKSWDIEVVIEVVPDNLKSDGKIKDGSQKDKLELERKRESYKECDADAKKWLNIAKPNLDMMKGPEIKAALVLRNRTLWTTKYSGWIRYQSVWPKRKVGKKKSVASSTNEFGK